MGRWTVDVAGALTVTDESEQAVALRPKERAIVAAVALLHPEPASVAEIIELLWADPPTTARKAIHNHVARLRATANGLIESVDAGGYRLGDAVRISAPADDDVFADLVDLPRLAVARTRFRDARLRDEEAAAARALAHRPTDSDLATMVALAEREPHRWERWRLAALTAARRGRRPTALDLLRAARSSAALSSGERHQLERLEVAVLDDDPRLDVDDFAAHRPADDRGDQRHDTPMEVFVDAGGTVDELERSLEASASGAVALVGPAGAGKTTICARVRDRAVAAGWECHTVTARSYASTTDDLATSLRDSLLARRPTGDRAAAPDDDPLAACIRLLATGQRRRLVVVDDLHHASADEHDAVDTLVGHPDVDGTVRWIVSSRQRPRFVTEQVLEIEPWTPEAVRQLLLCFAPPSIWLDGAARWIADQADGNALAVRELSIDMVRRRASTTDHGGRFVAPSTADAPLAWVRRRIERLADDARGALAGAGMVGVDFDLATLGAFSSDAAAVVAAARLEGVIAATDGAPQRFRFTHDLFRDALLDGLGDDDRARLALVALRHPVFDGDEESRRRAMLARIAAHDDPARAISETIEAAELERSRRHPVEAERLFRRAIELIERHDSLDDETWLEARLGLGSVAVSNGRSDATEILLGCATVAARVGHGRLGALAVYEASRIGLGSTVGQSNTEIGRAIGDLRAIVDDPFGRAHLDMAEMAVFGIGTDGARARRLLDDAMAAAAAADDPDLEATTRRSAYMAVSRPVDLPARRAIADDLRRRGEQTGDPTLTYEARRLDFSIVVETGASDPRPILVELEQMHASFNERSRNWSLFAFRCVIAHLDGDLDRLQAGIDLLMSPETAVSPTLKLSTAGGHQVGLHLLRGDLEVLDPVVAAIERDIPELPVWNAARAATAAAAGDRRTAAARLAAARRQHDGVWCLDLPDDFTGLPSAHLIGEAALGIGDHDTLRLAADVLEHHRDFWVWHGTGTFGPIDLVLARWANASDAIDLDVAELARSALASAGRVGAPHFVASAADLLATRSTGAHR